MSTLEVEVGSFLTDVETFLANMNKAYLGTADEGKRLNLLLQVQKLKCNHPTLNQSANRCVAASSLANVVKSGYLIKRKDKVKFQLTQSSRKWCVISDGVIYLFEKPASKKQTGSITLTDYVIKKLPTGPGKEEYGFELVCKKHQQQPIVFTASSEVDLGDWMKAIIRSGAQRLAPEPQAVPTSPTLIADSIDTEDSFQFYGDVAQDSTQFYGDVAHTEQCQFYGDVAHLEMYGDASSAPESSATYGNASSLETTPAAQRPPAVKPKTFDYESLYFALWDCDGDEPDELSFRRGEIIQIVSRAYEEYDWLTGLLNGQVGLVPMNHIVPAYEQVVG